MNDNHLHELDAEGIRALIADGALSAIACQYADFVCRHAGLDDQRLWLAAALASQSVEDSHVCMELPRLYKSDTPGIWPVFVAPTHDKKQEPLPARVKLPPEAAWRVFLKDDCANVVGAASTATTQPTPLVVDEKGRLYLHRYFVMEQKLAAALAGMNEEAPAYAMRKDASVRGALEKLFPHENEPEWKTNWPKIAAFAALRNRLTVITGGPGTGKTSVVGKLVLLIRDLCTDAETGSTLRVKLAAPTGKAAARLGQGLDECFAKLKKAGDYPVNIEDVERSASTLHRLLGYQRNSIHFRHNADNPLEADLIIVDEASMVTLPQMLRLVDAVPEGARLILLGDMKQLASVDSGFVLGDLCTAMQPTAFTGDFRSAFAEVAPHPKSDVIPTDEALAPTLLSDACVELRYSWRFRPGSHVYRVSQAINNEDGARTLAEQAEEKTGLTTSLSDWLNPGILRPLTAEEAKSWDEDSPPRTHVWHRRNLPNFLIQRGKPASEFVAEKQLHLHDRFQDYLRATDPAQALAAFERFRILCAMRRGPHGVVALNTLVESVLGLDYAHERAAERERLEKLDKLCLPAKSKRRGHYDHRPILITENNYALGLFNGDTGVILKNPDHEIDKSAPRLLAWFPPAADAPEQSPPRPFLPEMLPAHETAFAVTIHKSQGSQWDDVLVVLPHRDNPVIGRELIYTAVTRVKRRAELWLPPDPDDKLFDQWVSRATDRHSGLVDAISEAKGRQE